MPARKKVPTKVKIDLPEPEAVGAPVEQHEPVVVIVRSDEMEIAPWQVEMLDRAFANGTTEGPDGRFAYRIDPVPEAVEVFYDGYTQIYVRIGEARGNKGQFHEEWQDVTTLRPTKFNGYLLACPLRSELSKKMFDAIELACGRAHGDSTGADAEGDATFRKHQRIELRRIEALVEVDPSAPGSASKAQFIRYQGCWLCLRRIPHVRGYRPQKQRRSYPDIKVL